MLKIQEYPNFIQPLLFILLVVLVLFFFNLLSIPALSGTFELDDFSNLSGLAKINDLDSALRYLLSYYSHGTGRPVSLFTFALQHNSWPNPYDFKLFNLILHQINAFLIFLLAFQLIKLNYTRSTAIKLSLLISALWLFAPIHFFAVFYTIQRMTLLSSFFILIGINVHIFLRHKFNKENNVLKSYLIISISFIISTLLALLSKENGILICIYLLIIEFLFLNDSKLKYWSLWRVVFLISPIILLIVYLILSNKLSYSPTPQYPFDPLSRLWNEAVILWEYIYSIIIPTPGAYGLVYDDINIIQSLWKSPEAILAVLMIVIAVLTSYYYKSRFPFLLFGLLWFLGGHLLESTAVKLELRFDHRNYLPAFGIIYLLVFSSYTSLNLIHSKLIKCLIYLLITGYLAFYVNNYYQLTQSWSSETALINYQITHHPKSLRTQYRYLTHLFNKGDYKNTAILLSKMEHERPKNISLKLTRLLFSSLHPAIVAPKTSDYLQIARQGDYDRAIDSVMMALFKCIRDNLCQKLTFHEFRDIIAMLQLNPKIKHSPIMDLMTVLKSKSYSLEEKWPEAVKVLQNAENNKKRRIDFYFILLQNQYMANDYDAAKKTIQIIENKLESKPLIKTTVTNTLDMFKYNIKQKESHNIK